MMMSEREIKGKATLERDDKGGAGTTRIILQSVNPSGRSSASLPDGTVLVACSRQPLLDAARVLMKRGYSPNTRIEMWRPGASQFAMRPMLGAAARLTVDETRTVFAPWKPFSSSAVVSPVSLPGGTATALAGSLEKPSGAPSDDRGPVGPLTNSEAGTPSDRAAPESDARNKLTSNTPVPVGEETDTGA